MKLRFFPEIFLVLAAAAAAFSSCNQAQRQAYKHDQVFNAVLPNVRLGDGVPLSLDIWVRWKIEKPSVFYQHFLTADAFNRMGLLPRALETSNTVANRYASVDSVFAPQRELFIEEVKRALLEKLGEEAVAIKEVTVGSLAFPKSYTDAMAAAGMKRQLVEGIRQQNDVALEQAAADRKKAEADAQVAIARAEADAKLARIEAHTEDSRRQSQLARAETAAQIARRQGQAQADSLRQLNKAELERLADLKELDVQKRRSLDDLDVEKKRKEKRADLDSQLELAEVVQENPAFAAFLINRELASKVDIAVLPTGADASMLGGFWQQKK